MRIRDKLIRDRRVWKTLDRTDRLLFIWDYYKLPVIALAAAILLTAVTLVTSAGSGKTAMYAVFVNTFSSDGDREALDGLLTAGGVDMGGKHVDVTAGLHWSSTEDSSENAQTTQILAALFGITGLDFFASDEAVFERYAVQGAFLDLSLFLDREILARHAEDLYYCEDQSGQRILAGIRLHDGSPLHEAGYYLGDVVVGVAARAEYMDEALCLLKQLL